MVIFDPQKAKSSIGIPVGKHELQLVQATFGMNKSGNPMVTIELKNHLGQTGRTYISESQWSDNQIQRLLASAQSCGATIPLGYDFQVNGNLAGFLNQKVKKLYVSVKEDGDYTKIQSFLVRPEVSPEEQAGAFDPFAQPQPQAVQAEQNLFTQAPPAQPAPQGQYAQPQPNPFAQPDPLAGMPATPEQMANNPYAQGQLPPVQQQQGQQVDIPQSMLDNMPFDTAGLQGTGAPAQPNQDWTN